MDTGSRPLLAAKISSAAVICLALTALLLTSCDRPTASNATTASSSPTPRIESALTGVILRADPNPVPNGSPDGNTTITWDTSSNDVGDVYVSAAGSEKLFASSPKGSQNAPWIKPGSTEFRLYRQSDHKLLAQLTVTMPSGAASASSPKATPVSSASSNP